MPPPFARTVHLEADEVVEYGNDPVDTDLYFEVEAGTVYASGSS